MFRDGQWGVSSSTVHTTGSTNTSCPGFIPVETTEQQGRSRTTSKTSTLRIGLGVGLGVGVPVLLSIFAALYFCLRRRGRYNWKGGRDISDLPQNPLHSANFASSPVGQSGNTHESGVAGRLVAPSTDPNNMSNTTFSSTPTIFTRREAAPAEALGGELGRDWSGVTASHDDCRSSVPSHANAQTSLANPIPGSQVRGSSAYEAALAAHYQKTREALHQQDATPTAEGGHSTYPVASASSRSR